MVLIPEPVSIEVEGERLDVWTSYELDSDLMTPADGWRVQLAIGDGHDSQGRRTADRAAFTRIRDLCRTNASVRVFIGSDGTKPGVAPRSLQLAGVIDERRTAATRDRGSTIEIEGRDVAAYLTDSAVPYDLKIEADTLFLDMVRAVVRPWGLEVTAESTEGRLITTGRTQRESRDRQQRLRAIDAGIARELYVRSGGQLAQAVTGAEGATQAPLSLAEGQVPPGSVSVDTVLARANQAEVARMRAARRYANKIPPVEIETIRVRDAKPRGGETAWQFLDRHARRLGLMLWADPAGRIVVSSPNLKATSVHRVIRRFDNDKTDPNNVIAGGCASNGADMFSEVRAYGRSRGGDATRSPFHASVRNDEVPFTRLRIVSDGSLRSSDEAERRARREVRMSRLRSRVFDYTVAGHSQYGILWATDTVVQLVDEVEGYEGPAYVLRRTFAGDKQGGSVTRLRLVPPDHFEL